MVFVFYRELRKKIPYIALAFGFLLPGAIVFAQKKDTIPTYRKKLNNIFHAAINAVSKARADSIIDNNILNANSEAVFLPYQGKGIRHIAIRQLGFEKTFVDTSSRIMYFGTRLLNHLHRNSRSWVIHNNLFIHEKAKIDAYQLADNERYLRSLEFIQDARIVIKPIPGMTDSVDVDVVVKDLFSITAEIDDLSPGHVRIKGGDANVAGLGQKLLFGGLMDQDRNPSGGFELFYSKTNIAGTFINATVDFNNTNGNLFDGREDEHALSVKFERPLVSQYTHLAGAISFSNNESFNLYNEPSPLFYQYHYNNFDVWGGYNLDVKQFIADAKLKNRTFLSARYFRNQFMEKPVQVANQLYLKYNNTEGVLGQLTFFKQDFYKTNYIYGFGITEDIPYGYNVALTGGWMKQEFLSRPYIGIDANKYIITDSGYFFQYFLRAGGFWRNGQLQDAGLLIGGSMFSRLFIFKSGLKVREYLRFSMTGMLNRVGLDPLRIDNPFGLTDFHSDSALGDRRVTLQSQTFLYLKYKLFGFQFAPFVFENFTLLTPEHAPPSKSELFYGIGGGVRTRNENLVFGTIELRMIYYPRKEERTNSFAISINTNLKFKYNNVYVKEPDIVQLNSDVANNIY